MKYQEHYHVLCMQALQHPERRFLSIGEIRYMFSSFGHGLLKPWPWHINKQASVYEIKEHEEKQCVEILHHLESEGLLLSEPVSQDRHHTVVDVRWAVSNPVEIAQWKKKMPDLKSIYRDLLEIHDHTLMGGLYSLNAANICYHMDYNGDPKLENEWNKVTAQQFLNQLEESLLISCTHKQQVFDGVQDVLVCNYDICTPVEIARKRLGFECSK